MRFKTIQSLIDKIRGKNKYGLTENFLKIQEGYSESIIKLREKALDNKKIRVCFLVVFDSTFPAKPLFEKMLKDDVFDPRILIIPDVSRGIEHQFYQLKKSYETFASLYGKELVINSYCYENETFIDYTNDFDIACFANPYDHMTNNLYTIDYWSQNSVLPIYVNYCFMISQYSRKYVINLKSMNLCWKIFADTEENLEEFKKYTARKGENAVLSGYCKMDELFSVNKQKTTRKKIIISPHHSVNMSGLKLSNFLQYYNFFLELPDIYPQIDFVFRPHPLLFVTLSNDDLWGKERVEEYINKITSYPNVIYQNGGNYFDTFLNSDGIIHDCGSFIMEYLYTENPACYMVSSANNEFLPITKNSLKHHYLASNKQEIIDFIENIILKENDFMKNDRIKFAKEKIMINYPNVADYILENIKESFR